jgi:hypothetical protein
MTERINVNGNYGTVISTKPEVESVTLKVYVHTREGRFVTATELRVSEQYLRALLARIQTHRDAVGQPMLPPWDQEGDDNVRWLPPQP